MKPKRRADVITWDIEPVLDTITVQLVVLHLMKFSGVSSVRSIHRGFTLIEIMVVIAILGLLATVLLQNVGGSLGRGQEKTAELFVNNTLKLPLTNYRIDNGSFPTTAQGLQALIVQPQNAPRWKGPYMEVKGGQLPLDPWQQPYEYRYPGTNNKSSFDLFSKGQDMTAGTEDDIGNW